MGINPQDKKLTTRINRIKGQINGIQRMLDEGRDCTEVIIQIQAARAGLSSLGEEIIRDEASCCVNEEERPEKQIQRLQTLVKNLFKIS